jgi:hypothetical protein
VVCVATLLRNTVRLVPTIGDGYERRAAPDTDPRFADNFAAVQGIVTGNALDDPGMFVRDIADNLEDPRYLPFENAGVIGEWHIELPASRNALDLSTVTDVKLHLHYTALDGGAPLRGAAQMVLDAAAPDTVDIAFDARSEFTERGTASFRPSPGASSASCCRSGPGCCRPSHEAAIPASCAARSTCSTTIRAWNSRYRCCRRRPRRDALASGTVSYREFDMDPALPLEALTVRVRERGVADWASLPPDRLNGMIIAVRLELT